MTLAAWDALLPEPNRNVCGLDEFHHNVSGEVKTGIKPIEVRFVATFPDFDAGVTAAVTLVL